MGDDTAFGFWSYTHQDNKMDGGNILQLSRLIMEEYDLLSGGEPLNLFVDRDDLAWGQQWRLRIDSSIAETTFFIPIITPRYFKRPECRRELLEFAAKASILGAQELLLPILYIETPGLSADSSDEAVALVAKTQYVDWRRNRLLEPRSGEYKVAVNSLAQRLLGIAKEVAAAQFKHELISNPADESVDGVNEIVARIEGLLPEWLDAVMGEKSANAQVAAVYEEYLKQYAKLNQRKSPPSALLSTKIRMAREMLPLAERGQRDSQVYLARSVELDPLISGLVRLINQHPDAFPLTASVREAIDEAMEEIRHRDKTREGIVIQDQFKSMTHLGRIFQQCNSAFVVRLRNADEGNEIVRRWHTGLIEPASLESKQVSLEIVGNPGDEDSPPPDAE